MFNKKSCKKCKKEIKKDYEFCPYCGTSLDNSNTWGMLGKNDNANQNPFTEIGLGGGFLNKMLGSAMKMLENEMQKEMKNKQTPQQNTKVQLYINGQKIPVGNKNIKIIKKSQNKPQKEKKEAIVKMFSTENQKKFANLPRTNPETNVRRLSDRVIYEINLPGIDSIEDVSIRNLQNSIEIKAISKETSYYKVLSIGFPIIDFYMDKNKLILELEAKN